MSTFPITTSLGKSSHSTFAFVRFRYKSELEKVIKEGNNQKMDGRLIKVKEASDRRSQKEISIGKSKMNGQSHRGIHLNPGLIEKGRAYKETLLWVNMIDLALEIEEVQSKEEEVSPGCSIDNEKAKPKVINYDIDFQYSEME
ncbi:hypothetical protein REPUB_Repub19eG0093900 [Reevesia pubescens]